MFKLEMYTIEIVIEESKSFQLDFNLTIMGHSQRQALLEATILALVSILLLNLTGPLTAIIFEFHPHSPPEKALTKK